MYSIAVVCGLFLLSLYGVRGNFDDKSEEYWYLSVMATGIISLVITAGEGLRVTKRRVQKARLSAPKNKADTSVQISLLAFLSSFLTPSIPPPMYFASLFTVFESRVISEDIKRGESITSTDHEPEDFTENHKTTATTNTANLTELSFVWLLLGVVIATIYCGLVITTAFTSSPSHVNHQRMIAPLATLSFITFSLFARPRRRDTKELWFLRIHFACLYLIPSCLWIVVEIMRQRTGYASLTEDHIKHALLLVLEIGCIVFYSIGFHYALKLRALIGQLPDVELDEFLIETLFGGCFKMCVSVLFVLFRASKCELEVSDSESRAN